MATEGDVLLERSRLDTRHEMKVGKFSGRDEEWANWALKFEAYTGLLGYEQVMATACDHPGELDYATFSGESQVTAKELWFLLISYTEGKALSIVRVAGRFNGLEAWRALKNEYEGKQAGRMTAMMRFILNPGLRWTADRERGADFTQSLAEWETTIAELAALAGENISEAIRVSIILEHAPDPYKEMLRASPDTVRATYKNLRNHILSYYTQGRTFDKAVMHDSGGVAPMQVDAVFGGKKGKKGDPKGKGKEKGKYDKGKSKGKTKSKPTPSGSTNATPFEGECGYCGKWGHKRAECRKRLRRRTLELEGPRRLPWAQRPHPLPEVLTP